MVNHFPQRASAFALILGLIFPLVSEGAVKKGKTGKNRATATSGVKKWASPQTAPNGLLTPEQGRRELAKTLGSLGLLAKDQTVDSAIPLGDLFADNTVSEKNFLSALLRLSRYVELRTASPIFEPPTRKNFVKLGLNPGSENLFDLVAVGIRFKPGTEPKNSPIATATAINYLKKAMKTLAVAKHSPLPLTEPAVKIAAIPPVPAEDRIQAKFPELVDRYRLISQTAIMTSDQGMTRGEALELLGSLVKSCRDFNTKGGQTTVKGRPYGKGQAELFTNNLALSQLNDPGRFGHPFSRAEFAALAAEVLRYCELHLGFDANPHTIKATFADVRDDSPLGKDIRFFAQRSALPYSGTSFEGDAIIQWGEALDWVARYLNNGTNPLKEI